MAGRILSLQRQARELGRLRTGYTDTSGRKPRPVRSNTWIVSSHAEHYVKAAAEAWGGDVEKWNPQGGGAPQFRVVTIQAALDAILPPGDPLSQSYEMWSNGGCTRRCDGVTELLSDSPCVCRSKHGDDFHELAKGSVCSATTRLNVFLPEMPDVGVWRMETHSFYAAQEIAGAVDLIKGAVGHEAAIPIRLRIEQRMRKAGGETKKFPVVVVELRGITTGQVLEGTVLGSRPAIEASSPRAIEALKKEEGDACSLQCVCDQPCNCDREQCSRRGDIDVAVQIDVESVKAAIGAVDSLDDLRTLWPDAKAAGLEALAKARAAELQDPASDGDDADELYSKVMKSVPEDWSTTKVEEEFKKFCGMDMETAGGIHLKAYLDHLAAS